MDSRDVYKDSGEGHFLKVADLKLDNGKFANLTVKVSKWEQNEYQGEQQIVLSFEGKDKKMGLNKTNWRTMVAMFGHETEDWTGQSIRIYVDPTVQNPNGDTVGGVRIQYQAPEDEGSDVPF